MASEARKIFIETTENQRINQKYELKSMEQFTLRR